MENPRTDSARLHDDSDIIDNAESAPAHGGSIGGNLKRDIGTRAQESHGLTGDGDGVTRVRDSDKPEDANLPRFNER